MLVGGCGGSSNNPTPGFAARAVAICKSETLQTEQAAEAGGQLVDILAKLDAVEASAERQLAALTPPASQKAAFARFLAAHQRAYAAGGDLTQSITQQDQLDVAANADAASAGIAGCAEGTVLPHFQPAARTPASARALIAALADRRHLSQVSIPVGHNPFRLATWPGGVWVANNDNTVTLIDPRTGNEGSPISITGSPDGIAVGQGAVWIVSQNNNTVTRIDTRRRTAVATVINGTPSAIADGGVVWVANWSDGTVIRLDPSNGNIVGRPIHVGNGPSAIALDPNTVWVANEQDNTVSRIDPIAGTAIGKAIRVGHGPAALAVAHGTVWVENSTDNTLTRIDANTGTVVGRPIPSVANADGIAVGLGAVWVLAGNGHTVTRIDPSTGGALGQPIPVGTNPSSIAVGPGGAWIVSQNRITRIRP
jgi:DNA-binding beta-propeller fold protein YncE